MKRVNQYVETFSKMIAYETVSSPNEKDLKKFYGFHKLLKQLFPHVFKKCIVEEFDGSLLIKWAGKSSDKPILFMNHHDVVPALGDWKYPPFSAKVAKGKMWGRGTLDTKGGLFAMLQAADELIADGFVPSQDIYFESACNEETTGDGCKNIVKVLKKRKIKFDFSVDEGGMIVYEPMAGVKASYAMIGLGERGQAGLRFVAKSNGGHASTPGNDTPLVRLGKMMAYMDEHNIFDVYVSDVIVEMLKRLSTSIEGPISFVYKHAKLFRPLLKVVMPKVSPVAKAMCQTTLAFTMASGSEAKNVLPQQAVVVGDMRTSNHQGIKNSIEAVKKVAAMFDVDVIVDFEGVESNVASINSRGFKLAEKAVDASYGHEIKTAPYIMNQCSDSRFVSEICDTCLRFTPLSITNDQMKTIHGLDENVDVDCLDKAVDFYKYMMKEN